MFFFGLGPPLANRFLLDHNRLDKGGGNEEGV